MQDVAVVDIPAGIALNNAVHVVFVNTVDRSGSPLAQPAAAYPRLAVRVGDGSQLKLRQSYFTVDKQGNKIEGLLIILLCVYIHTYIHLVFFSAYKYILACIQSYVLTYSYIHTSIHKYIMYIHTYIQGPVEPNLVVSNTRILVGRNSRVHHTYLQELSGQVSTTTYIDEQI